MLLQEKTKPQTCHGTIIIKDVDEFLDHKSNDTVQLNPNCYHFRKLLVKSTESNISLILWIHV